MPRSRILLLAGAIALAACSGSGADSSPTTLPPPPAAPADDGASPEPAADAVDDNAMLADVVPQWSVSIDVVAEGFEDGSVDASVGWTGDPDAVVENGPFGSFGSCSGLRERVGAYSVFVSGTEEADLVGVWTADRVSGAGIYDAEVRIERAGLAPLTASGTMTILDGLQRGEFLAFGGDGGRIEGTFSCSGAEPSSPLRTGPTDDGTVDSVEVFALLRNGAAERVVGLATDSSDAACASGSEIIVGVEGDVTTGAITTFELGGGPTTSARLRVAGAGYAFADVTVSLDDTNTSGVFSGTNVHGISIEGAFHCT
jgi:hypothetical protein